MSFQSSRIAETERLLKIVLKQKRKIDKIETVFNLVDFQGNVEESTFEVLFEHATNEVLFEILFRIIIKPCFNTYDSTRYKFNSMRNWKNSIYSKNAQTALRSICKKDRDDFFKYCLEFKNESIGQFQNQYWLGYYHSQKIIQFYKTYSWSLHYNQILPGSIETRSINIDLEKIVELYQNYSLESSSEERFSYIFQCDFSSMAIFEFFLSQFYKDKTQNHKKINELLNDSLSFQNNSNVIKRILVLLGKSHVEYLNEERQQAVTNWSLEKWIFIIDIIFNTPKKLGIELLRKLKEETILRLLIHKVNFAIVAIELENEPKYLANFNQALSTLKLLTHHLDEININQDLHTLILHYI